MPDVQEVVNGLEMSYKYSNVDENNTLVPQRIVLNALALLKDSGQDEGWLCEKRTSGRQPTDLLCACGNKVYFTTLLFKDGFTANELYCPNCGLSMRSPHHDKDGVWLRKHWEEVVLKAPQPRVMTLEEIWKCGDNEPIFLEYVLPTKTVLKAAVFQPDSSDDGNGDGWMCVVSAWCASGFYNRKEYGKTWRCWTAKPTDEQRKAVKWE